MALPVVRRGAHQAFHRPVQRPVAIIRQQVRGDQVQCIERLAQDEGQFRPDLENGKAVGDEGGQRGRALIVGGMRLEHQRGVVGQNAGQGAGLGGVIEDHVLIAEFDARLHHDAHHAAQRIGQPAFGEDAGVNRDGLVGIGRGGGGDRVKRMVGAAGGRDLGPDDVDRHRPARLARGILRDGGKARGAGGDGHVVGRGGVVGAGHRGVEMQLEEPGPGIGRDHAFGLGHRRLGRKVAPGVGAKVIAAQHDLPLGTALLPRQIVHPRHKIGGRHAGIAAPVVDLVAGRLDQHGRARLAPVAQGGAQHDRMGGTDRGDAPWRSGPEKGRQIG